MYIYIDIHIMQGFYVEKNFIIILGLFLFYCIHFSNSLGIFFMSIIGERRFSFGGCCKGI